MTRQSITVNLDERSYPIVIGSSLLEGGFDLAEYVKGPDCLVVSNETVAPLYLDKLRPCLGDKAVESRLVLDREGGEVVDRTPHDGSEAREDGQQDDDDNQDRSSHGYPVARQPGHRRDAVHSKADQNHT